MNMYMGLCVGGPLKGQSLVRRSQTFTVDTHTYHWLPPGIWAASETDVYTELMEAYSAYVCGESSSRISTGLHG